MPDLIAEFCEHHFAYNDISASRRRQQPKVLRAFEDFIDVELTAADGEQLLAYLASRVATIAPATVAKEMNMIRPFYAWLYQRKAVSGDQLMSMREVKPPRGSSAGAPKPYTEKEMRRFWREFPLSYPWANGDGSLDRGEYFVERWKRGSSAWVRVTPYARRLQAEAIVALALNGGLRMDEIFRASIDDIHPDNAYVVARGARKNTEGRVKIRPVPWVVPEMREHVRKWLEFRALLPVEHDGVWLTLRPAQHALNPMQKRAFSVILAHVGSGWQFHRMRHTAATEMLRSGYAVEEVRDILGHTNITMTMRYVKLIEGDLLRAAKRSEGNLAKRMTSLRYPDPGESRAAA